MNVWAIVFRSLAGVVLGLFFYGGLWYSVSHLADSRHAILLAVGSFWIRVLAVLAGFLFLMESRWEYALILMAGFTMGRLIVSMLLKDSGVNMRCT